ncbi:MAG: polysaccharide deacetylase family protein [Lentisphaerae bacterium]|nr:polysaccharide deacetylase family protein [Lentisphaerota bacterium]MBT5608438.1 polysaccharide deacetylase family protein [Lentisphaerota bacterium]MBT7055162.1 polysaccharide deacetylase family protein [Lentisphaerota bacterium]MBT7841308.1 polysaccharide deacetylase family protein [Lentisphaerota bacterium]
MSNQAVAPGAPVGQTDSLGAAKETDLAARRACWWMSWGQVGADRAVTCFGGRCLDADSNAGKLDPVCWEVTAEEGAAIMWPNGKRWVYSITYDEGCQALLDHAVPIHRRYGVPGHLALVASQIGVPRDVPGSSYDGMQILSRDEIHMLCDEGWGVSCHGMTHAHITEENVAEEVYAGREQLSTTLDMSVTMFCLPGNNTHHEIVKAHAAKAGYTSIMTIYDDVNRADVDLLRLCRCPLHQEYPPPFYSAYDPYKRLHQAIDCGGWIIDYCHCPTPDTPIHPWKDCTAEQLAERFETVCRLGGDDVWLAEPNEVVKHLLEQRS